MDILQAEAELLNTTVPLWSVIRNESYPASGVFVGVRPLQGDEPIPYIVTAADVVDGAERLVIAFSHFGRNQRGDARRQAEIPGDALGAFIDRPSDLALIPAAAILSQLVGVGGHLSLRVITEELLPQDFSWSQFGAFERATVISHPEFLPFTLPRVPVAQSGVTATRLSQNYNDRGEFLVDVPALPGVVGGAVFVQRSLFARSDFAPRLTFGGVVVEHLRGVGIGVSNFARVVKSTAVFERLQNRLTNSGVRGV